MARGLHKVHLLTGRLVPHWSEIFEKLRDHYSHDNPSLQIIQAPVALGGAGGAAEREHLVGLQMPTRMKFEQGGGGQ